MREKLKRERKETAALLSGIPVLTVTLFVVSVISMNLLANKTLLQMKYLALDGGILISWLSFMCMDVITKHFGPKAGNRISLLACGVNLLTCLIFFIASIIPSKADDYTAFNTILGGTWFILLGSTVAFLSSAAINNGLNFAVGKLFVKNPDGRPAFYCRTFVSTFIGQFADNLIFSVIVFMVFAPVFWDGFHWTFIQCVMCALTGAGAELLMEVIFSPFAYRITEKWRRQHVGEAYLALMKEEQE